MALSIFTRYLTVVATGVLTLVTVLYAIVVLEPETTLTDILSVGLSVIGLLLIGTRYQLNRPKLFPIGLLLIILGLSLVFAYPKGPRTRTLVAHTTGSDCQLILQNAGTHLDLPTGGQWYTYVITWRGETHFKKQLSEYQKNQNLLACQITDNR